MRKILYIHGFGSDGNSHKGQLLKLAFGEKRVLTPSLPIGPAAAWHLLSGLISSNAVGLVVGTSLGGLYADLVNHQFARPALLINPVVDLADLRPLVGPQINFNTGEPFEFRSSDLAELGALRQRILSSGPSENHPTVLIADDDESLSAEAMATYYQARGCPIYRYSSGGHRFANPGVLEGWVSRLLDPMPPS